MNEIIKGRSGVKNERVRFKQREQTNLANEWKNKKKILERK
jgi:hypothetical protein